MKTFKGLGGGVVIAFFGIGLCAVGGLGFAALMDSAAPGKMPVFLQLSVALETTGILFASFVIGTLIWIGTEISSLRRSLEKPN